MILGIPTESFWKSYRRVQIFTQNFMDLITRVLEILLRNFSKFLKRFQRLPRISRKISQKFTEPRYIKRTSMRTFKKYGELSRTAYSFEISRIFPQKISELIRDSLNEFRTDSLRTSLHCREYCIIEISNSLLTLNFHHFPLKLV